jgi:hypothetical protein
MLCNDFAYDRSIYFLFITSTYRDLVGFLTPLAPETERVDNKASKGSTVWPGGGNAVDVGLDGGNTGSFRGTSFAGGVAEADGVGAGGCAVVN